MKATKSIAMLAAILMLYSAGAAAQLSFHDPATNQGILDQVITEFATRASTWQGVVMNAATWLFWTLGTISLVWTGGMMILRKADIGEFFAEFVRFILFFGFFLWLLRNGPAFADSIIKSLRQLGDSAAGTTGLSPSGIVDVGFLIWKQAIANLSAWSPIDSFVGTAMSAGVMLLLAAVAVNMLLLLVSAWILMYAGIFFLGFGGSRWTSDIAINYYKTVLGVAVQLFTMILLIGIGTDLLSTFYTKMNKGQLNFEELGVMLVFCMALLLLVNRAPPLLAGVITGGGVGSSGGIGNFGAGAVVGAGGMAAATAATGGAMLAAGAASAGGGAQALMAAVSKANENVQGGNDLLTSMWSGSGGTGGGEDRGESTGSTPFAQAAGFSSSGGAQASTGTSGGLMASAAKAGLITADATANLAKGAAQVVKGKATSIKEAANERLAETTGGKVAAAIRAGNTHRPTDEVAQCVPAFDGNSLASTLDESTEVDVESEIAAFVNRDEQAV